ncbi:MAG TPA: NUDIX domain-containing protein, partial [Coleofasciculaceae cyanobacterium]
MPTFNPRAAVAIAILYQNNRFLMQLRDENPEIAYPGCWAFFGGHIEPEEPPDIAIRRE